MYTDLHIILFLFRYVSKHYVYILGLLCQHTLKLKGSSWVEFFKLYFYLFRHLPFQRKRMPLFTICLKGIEMNTIELIHFTQKLESHLLTLML